ncbi:NRDE family protein [Virgibacillus sp. W0181]|uniref:NRDE family protein n=1 Tax=Virgibacillus sp. W0181 TaxID=3391581 RepID=UPI003F4753A2
MCLINFQFHEHPNYKLILTANRDEFYNRPTAAAHFWEDYPQILAGRDLQRMGTWLGITKTGRFAALTNYRDSSQKAISPRSRGDIVANYLKKDTAPAEYIASLQKHRQEYNGYNIIVGDPDQLFYYSNIENEVKQISPGTHGLSNHFLNTPWPKVIQGNKNLKSYTSVNQTIDQPDELFRTISDTTEANDENLPDTGVGYDLERKLSSQFIVMPDYGTRASTVLLVDKNNYIYLKEKTFENGRFTCETQFSFAAE